MGIVLAVIRDTFPPKPTFSVDDIADLTGKVIIVTGGNTGLGKETVKVLLQHNATVYMTARNPTKAKEAIEDLKTITGKEANFIQLDLADLASVKEAAHQFLEKEKGLHILINNAGVMMSPVEEVTKDGYDLQFGTNVLGHFYFTKLLLPVLLSTSTAAGSARIVTLASNAGSSVSGIKYDTLKDGPARIKFGTISLYNQSKFANIVFAKELARRYGDNGIVSVSVHPGGINSELQRHVHSPILQGIMKMIGHPVSMGVLTPLYAATHPDGASLNGKYYQPWAREGEHSASTLVHKTGEDLWNFLEEQVAAFESSH